MSYWSNNVGSKKRLVIFGIAIVFLAFFTAIFPMILAKYMRMSYKKVPAAEFMIKVKGIVKQSKNIEKTIYLQGDNGLYYVLTGDQTIQLQEYIGKTTTVFGNIMTPLNKEGNKEQEFIDKNPVRMRVSVIRFEFD
ncbi:MAG: hypothetical protein LBU55_00650 [Elusimicrobiota bacterium]|jgi:hypothetical protein|nr:hypothetical protein [Elusimicrobiota bacterium]